MNNRFLSPEERHKEQMEIVMRLATNTFPTNKEAKELYIQKLMYARGLGGKKLTADEEKYINDESRKRTEPLTIEKLLKPINNCK